MNKKILIAAWVLVTLNPICMLIFSLTGNLLFWQIGMVSTGLAAVCFLLALTFFKVSVNITQTEKTKTEDKAPTRSYMILPFLNYSVEEDGTKKLYMGWLTKVYFLYWNEPK